MFSILTNGSLGFPLILNKPLRQPIIKLINNMLHQTNQLIHVTLLWHIMCISLVPRDTNTLTYQYTLNGNLKKVQNNFL